MFLGDHILGDHTRWYGVKLRHFGDYLCFYAPTFRRLSVLLVSYDISETMCALMLRRFGDCAVMVRRFGGYLLLCSDVSEAICALMLRRFGVCCYTPTFQGYLLLCSDVSETVLIWPDISETKCAVILRRFGGCTVLLRRFGLAVIFRNFGDYLCCYYQGFVFVISVSLGQKTGYGEDFRACNSLC